MHRSYVCSVDFFTLFWGDPIIIIQYTYKLKYKKCLHIKICIIAIVFIKFWGGESSNSGLLPYKTATVCYSNYIRYIQYTILIIVISILIFKLNTQSSEKHDIAL